MTTPTLSPAAERLLLTMLAIDPARPSDRWNGRNWYTCHLDDLPPALSELEAAGLAVRRVTPEDRPGRIFAQATAAGMTHAGIPANRITEITT